MPPSSAHPKKSASLKRLVSQRVLSSMRAHDKSSSESRNLVLHGVDEFGVMDLSCQEITSEVTTILLSGVATSKHRSILELNLTCSTIKDNMALKMLLELVQRTPSIETCHTEGCSGSSEWQSQLQQLCAENKENNRLAQIAKEEKESSMRKEQGDKLFQEKAPVLVRGHFNGYLEIENEEAIEWRMIIRASKYIQHIQEEENQKHENLENLLDNVKSLVTQQRHRRIALHNLQIRVRLEILSHCETSERGVMQDEQEKQRKKLWKQNVDGFQISSHQLQCRYANEAVERAALYAEAVRARSKITAVERTFFLKMCAENDQCIEALLEKQREQKQAIQDEKRRARQRQEEENRANAHKLERLRFENAQRQAQFLNNRSKIISQEESIRNRIMNAERNIIGTLFELWFEVEKVRKLQLKFDKCVSHVHQMMKVKASLEFSCSLNINNPLFVYENSKTWTNVDKNFVVSTKLPNGWVQSLESCRDLAVSQGIGLKSVRVTRQKKLRNLWESIVEASLKVDVQLSFLGADYPAIVKQKEENRKREMDRIAQKDAEKKEAAAAAAPKGSEKDSHASSSSPSKKDRTSKSDDSNDSPTKQPQQQQLSSTEQSPAFVPPLSVSPHLDKLIVLFPSIFHPEEVQAAQNKKGEEQSSPTEEGLDKKEKFESREEVATNFPPLQSIVDDKLRIQSGTIAVYLVDEQFKRLEEEDKEKEVTEELKVDCSVLGEEGDAEDENNAAAEKKEKQPEEPKDVLQQTHKSSFSINVQVVSSGAMTFQKLSQLLSTMEFYSHSKRFGAVRQLLLVVEGTLGDLPRARKTFPFCVLQNLLETHTSQWKCEGRMEMPLGSPWILRDIPLVRPLLDENDSDGSKQMEASVRKKSIAAPQSSSSGVEEDPEQDPTLPFVQTTVSNCDVDPETGALRPIAEVVEEYGLTLFPELFFDSKSASREGVRHPGFAGSTIEITLESGCNSDDRVFINTKVTKSLKLVLGVVSVSGAMIGKVEEGSLLKHLEGNKHVISLVSHIAVHKETVASILNALRFSCEAKNPIIGVREIKIRLNPPDRVGPQVTIPVEMEAVDVPTELDLVERKALYRSRCPMDVSGPLLEYNHDSSSPLFGKALVIDPDTEFFSGGHLKVRLDTCKPGDHLWIRNSDGRGVHSMEKAMRYGIHVHPTMGGIGTAEVWYFDKKIGDLSIVTGMLGGRSPVQSPSPTPAQEHSSPRGTGGNKDKENAASSSNNATSNNVTASNNNNNLQSIEGGGNNNNATTASANSQPVNTNSNTKDPQQSEHCFELCVQFVEDGTASLEGCQALVRSVCFTSSKTHPAGGKREVSVELLVGETENRVDMKGEEIKIDSANEIIRDFSIIRVTSCVVRIASRSSELQYLEQSGAKRITPMEVLTDEEAGVRTWAGFAKFDVDHPNKDDLLSVKALDGKDLFDPSLGNISVVRSEKSANKMKADLAAVLPQLLPVGPGFDSSRPDPLVPAFDLSGGGGGGGSKSPVPEGATSMENTATANTTTSAKDEKEGSVEPTDGLASGAASFRSTTGGKKPKAVLMGYPTRETNTEGGEADPVLFDNLDECKQMGELALFLRQKGLDKRFHELRESLVSYEFIKGGNAIATAYQVPGVVTICYNKPLARKEVSYLLRTFTYESTDKHPSNLQRVGRVTVYDGYCSSSAMFDITIVPVDDPLEILIHQQILKHRINCSEIDHFQDPPNVAEVLNTYRLQVPDHQALLVQEEPRSLFGMVRLMKMGGLTLEDPDTPWWDKGWMTVEASSGGVRGESIQLLSLTQQLQQYQLAGMISSKEGEKEESLEERLSKLLLLSVSEDLSTSMAVGENSTTNSGKKLVLNLVRLKSQSDFLSYSSSIDFSAQPEPDVEVVVPAIGTVTHTTKGQSATSLHIQFRGKNVPLSECCINIELLRYILNCCAYSFGNTTTPNSVTRTIKVVVSDGRNPTPGKASVTLEVIPPLLMTKEKAFQMNVQVTRTKQAVDAYPLFQKMLLNLPDNSPLTSGYIEAFVAEGKCTGDSFQMRIQGSVFSVGKENILSAAKDVMGRVHTVTEGYFRIDFLPNSKASTQKRIQELLKIIYFQFTERGQRDVRVVLAEVNPISGLIEHSVFRINFEIQ